MDNNRDTDIIDISEEIREKPQQKTEEQDTSVKQFRQRKKHGWIKWVVIGIIVLAIIGYIVYKIIDTKNKVVEALNSDSSTTAEIERMDISKAISSTGTIQSKDVRTITSPLSGVKIDEVNCKVGDMVRAGDVVVTFSREDINKKIDQLEEDIDEANKAKSLDSGDRTNTYVNSYDLQTYSVATSYDNYLRAGEDLQKAQKDLQKACDEKAEYTAKYEEAKEKIDGKKEELRDAQVDYDQWMQKFAPGGPTSEEDLTENYKKKEKISELQTKITEYESTIKQYDTGIDSYIKAEETAQSVVDKAKRSYDDAYIAYNKSGYDASFNGAKYDYNLNKGNLTADDSIKNLERQKEQNIDSLDNYIVTAPITGLVTAVNAQEGNGYQATTGALMTIQAVDIYEVTTQIDEYDINNVAVGQSVAIMTDATGQDELKGIVTFIAPTATAATGNSTSNTFEVKIDITEHDDRIKLGMSAKLNILVDTHKDVLAVPYDAIEERENGETFIYVVDKSAADKPQSSDSKNILGIEIVGTDGSVKNPEDKDEEKPGGFGRFGTGGSGFNTKDAKEIPVKIGLESDYYTEVISDQISEGMTVLVDSAAGEINNDMSMMMGM